MKLLSQNSKMKKSGKRIFNFTLPAFKAANGELTCPNAKNCISGCYARQGAYIWNTVSKKHNANYIASKHEFFTVKIASEIDSMRIKPTHIRIHDSGDFYSLQYFKKWVKIAQNYPNIQFYAYTKMISMIKDYGQLPENFKIIFSYGGSEDHLINPINDRHSWVFESIEQLVNSGYINASSNDLQALTENKNVGLVYHGAKSYKNTTWNNLIKSCGNSAA